MKTKRKKGGWASAEILKISGLRVSRMGKSTQELDSWDCSLKPNQYRKEP